MERTLVDVQLVPLTCVYEPVSWVVVVSGVSVLAACTWCGFRCTRKRHASKTRRRVKQKL